MFEHASLQEAYTGALIAGKGKLLNNIKIIMERIRFKHEDWARVRFGAGTPWRRCWCVISPPDEKEMQQQQKALKKKSAYDRVTPILKGNIKFYDTKKIKKGTRPIATINDAFSAYAIYPHSKPLIDQSTLVKVEGIITIHSSPETTTEGFVFVMPEAHAAVTGFEMMLRWLVPLYDVYGLYGRPHRLIADVLDVRSLMFALPQTRRYGYLDILDVAQLINEPGSQSWSEKEWRSRLKELTASRQTMYQANGGRPRSRASSYRGHRNSLPSRSGTIRFDDGASVKSAQSMRGDVPPIPPAHHTDSAPPGIGPFEPARAKSHQRSISEATPFSTPPRTQRSQRYGQESQNYTSSRLSEEQTRPYEQDGQPTSSPSQVAFEQLQPNGEPVPPMPPTHGIPVAEQARNPQLQRHVAEQNGFQERNSSESEGRTQTPTSVGLHPIDQGLRPSSPPKPVAPPPAFVHEPGAKPQKRPALSPEMRHATSRMSVTTLAQLADAGQLSQNGSIAAAGAAVAWNTEGQRRNGRTSEGQGHRGVIDNTTSSRTNADRYANVQDVILANGGHTPSDLDDGRRFAPSVDNGYHGVRSPGGISDHSPSRRDLGPPANPTNQGVSPLSRSSMRASIPEAYQQPPGVTNDPRPDIKRSSTSHSITRKPVPSQSSPRDPPLPLPAQPPSPSERSSLESLRQHVVDEDALAQVRSYTMESNQSHQPSVDESIYDDDSTASPDYASTRRSTDTRRSKPSMDRPRVGVLRTVGTVAPEQREVVVGDTRYQPGLSDPEITAAIPTVDFGPTLAYDPRKSSRPGTSGTMTPQLTDSANLSARLTPSPQPSPLEGSPGDKARGGSFPTTKPANSPYERSPSRNLHTPEGHRRTPSTGSEADNSRTVAWQPVAVGGGPGSRQSITAEQFVQQRATVSRVTPIYAHGRKQSGTPSPSGSRHPSGEIPTQQHHRQASFAKDLPPRPSSRGASTMMNAPADVSAHLSAREQEHVARVTGSPLINMAGNSPRQGQGPPGGGLVGAIEAREKEKREIREGVSSHMVQHAIAQRHQHNQAQQQRQQSFPQPSPQMPMPGAFPPSPQHNMPGAYPQSPQTPQFPPGPGQGQQQYGWGQQQPQYGQQHPQQRPQQWVSQAQRMYWGTAQQGAPHQQRMQQYQQSNIPQSPMQYNQGQQQQQYYGPYFGNAQGGRQ
ncbi:MAG: hypothetical protein Q9196_006589 [Gyalolechia fulgens]